MRPRNKILDNLMNSRAADRIPLTKIRTVFSKIKSPVCCAKYEFKKAIPLIKLDPVVSHTPTVDTSQTCTVTTGVWLEYADTWSSTDTTGATRTIGDTATQNVSWTVTCTR